MAAPVATAEYDVRRSGAYVNEVTLAPGNVNPSQFGRLWSYPVDGCVYAHPLFVPGVVINGQRHNVVYIATTNNSIFAYDADGPTLLWSKNYPLTTPRTPPTMPGDGDILGCNPTSAAGPAGIMSTPVIYVNSQNVAASLMWFVSGVQGQYTLNTVSITDGEYAYFGGNFPITAPGFNPAQELQRPALLLDPTATYISFAFSSYGDNEPYQGWVFTYRNDNSLKGALNLSPSGDNGAGVWMSGGGLATDGTYVYLTAGNNKSNEGRSPQTWGPSDYSNSILQWNQGSGSLQGAWVPPNSYRGPLDAGDADLGSSRAIFIPGWNYVVAGGKLGDFYIVNSASGMSSSSLVRQITLCPPTGEALYNGLAFWNNTLYTWCSSDDLKAWNFTNLVGGSTAGVRQANLLQGYQGGNVAISASGTTNGIVWATVPDGGGNVENTNQFLTGQLLAYDAGSLATLYTSHLSGLYWQKLTPPVIANGRVYVASASNQVLVYGPGGQNP